MVEENNCEIVGFLGPSCGGHYRVYQMKIRFVEEKPKVALCVISTGRIFKANRVIMKTKENLHVI